MTQPVHSRVTFAAPFSLKDVHGTHPAGTYSISTRDNLRWTFPFFWDTQTATAITICANPGLGGALHRYLVCPRDLDRAIMSDRARRPAAATA
jgi:hypothetical protein